MRPQPRTILIELFGLPGAGKTTLTKVVPRESRVVTRHQLVDRWSRRSPLRRAANVSRAYLRLGCVSAAVRLARAIPLSNRRSLVRLAKLVGRTDWLASQGGTLLLDQGLLQELWSILYDSRCNDPDPAVLAPLLKYLYAGLDATILYIDTDPATASGRIRSRVHGHSRLDELPEADLDQSMARSARLARGILDASAAAGLTVETLDGSKPVQLLVEDLQRALP